MIDTDDYGRIYYFAEKLDQGRDSKEIDGGSEPVQCSIKDANLLSSLCVDGLHRPVIDLDIPCRYVPSTTPGHGHLYIDQPMSQEQFQGILDAMAVAGVVQEGYRKYSKQRGMALVRPPWIRKPKKHNV